VRSLSRASWPRLTDRRQPGKIDHEVREMLSQRIFGLACGYADANDAARLAQALAAFVQSGVRSRLAMQAEILALRHQLGVYQRTCARPRLKPADRMLWAWLSRAWSGWRDALVFVKPETVIAWRRRKFREYWTRLSRSGKPGRPSIPREVRDLIRRMSSANSLWGAPRIVGELAKIGIDLPRSTVAKCMLRRRKPSGPPSKSSRPSPGWTRRSTSSGTGTRSTGRGSDNGLWASASRRSASPHSRRGKTHSPSGIVLEVAEVGGLQHHYERVAA
jgi:hypothetical protein